MEFLGIRENIFGSDGLEIGKNSMGGGVDNCDGVVVVESNVQPRASVIEDELVGLAEEPNAGDYADARKTGNVEHDDFAITLRGDVGSSVGRHDGVGIRSAGFAGFGRVDDTGTKIEFFDDRIGRNIYEADGVVLEIGS